jgi:long-chain acyl-CoA synthetase
VPTARIMEDRIWHKAYAPAVPPDIDFEEKTIPELFAHSADRFPDATALFFLNRAMSYRELSEQVDGFATGLRRLGVRAGDRVAVHLPNLPQTVISLLAILKLAAQVVMTNPLYVFREIEHQWKDAGCRVAITLDFLYEQHLREGRDRLEVAEYVIASIPDYLRYPWKQLARFKLRRSDPPHLARVAPGPGIHFFREMIRDATGAEPANSSAQGRGPTMDDVALLQYTGGTTGVSKGAMLTHRNLSSNAQQLLAWFPDFVPGREVIMAALPFFHIFGTTVGLLFPLTGGGAMVVMPNPRDIPRLVQAIAKRRVTIFPAVPAMFLTITQHPGIERADLRSIKSCFCGSAPLPLAVLDRFESLTGGRIVEGYGLTETSPVTHVNPLGGERKIGTIGVPIPSTDARIVDLDTGKTECEPGEVGELAIRGPQVMRGYWNRPEETRAVLRDGWLYTGDLAAVDEDGYFTILGRRKEMILASGYNVYPDEIDEVLVAHQGIREACTIGIPHPKRGETVKSFVVPEPGVPITVEEIERYCRANLAPYKVPRVIELREQLPRSAALKLLRRVLRDEELAKLQGERGSSDL